MAEAAGEGAQRSQVFKTGKYNGPGRVPRPVPVDRMALRYWLMPRLFELPIWVGVEELP